MPQVKDTNVHVNIYTLKYNSKLLSCIARKQRTNKAPKRLGEGHTMPKNLGEQRKNGASKYSVQVCLHFECHCSVNHHPVGSQCTFVAIVEVFLSTNTHFKLSSTWSKFFAYSKCRQIRKWQARKLTPPAVRQTASPENQREQMLSGTQCAAKKKKKKCTETTQNRPKLMRLFVVEMKHLNFPPPLSRV